MARKRYEYPEGSTPEERERIRQKRRREADPAREAERNRLWRLANPGKKSAYCKAWRARNKERNREKYRAQRLAAKQRRRASCYTSTDLAPTPAQVASILLEPCLYCGDPADHVDHFIPLSRGGLHVISNLVPACAACNTSKGNKLPNLEWRGRRGVAPP